MTTWDDKPNDYEHAVAMLKTQRNAIIEECARVAEQLTQEVFSSQDYWAIAYNDAIRHLTAAIRALKAS